MPACFVSLKCIHSRGPATILPVILFLMLIGVPSTGEEPPVLIEGVTLFEFGIVEQAEPSPYIEKILGVSMSMLEDHLLRKVDGLRLMQREPEAGPEEKALAARPNGPYYIEGEFEILEGNVIVRSHWLNLEDQTSGSHQVFLGHSILEDFDQINQTMEELSAKIVHDMVQAQWDSEPLGFQERILVSCFAGGESVDLGYFDRYLTLELPQFLQDSLTKHGISPDRIRVNALSFDRYGEECLGYASRKSSGEFTKRAAIKGSNMIYLNMKTRNRSPRYTVSGTILPGNKGFYVSILLQDQQSRGPITIAEYHAENFEDVLEHPKKIADMLSAKLAVYLVQDLLTVGELYEGRLNGTLSDQTEEALRRYQRDNDLEESGKINIKTLSKLGLR